ncbi:MAG: iron ABC transporter permease [Candidatus Omnitrophota bacterium]|nr:iron ABC transporter permease [Candidatus Omnitrophota bacterium]
MNNKYKRKTILLLGLLLVIAILGIYKGAVDISAKDLWLIENRPILYLRIFRIITAIVAGCGLSVAGIVLQAILKNSLAEPYILGASSGAGLGAVILMVLGVSSIYIPGGAFLGAVLSIILVYNLARQHNKINEQALILSGVIVSVALSAVIVFLISVSSKDTLHSITWWLWGSLQVYDYKLLILVSVVVFTGVLISYLFAQDLNAISIGDEEALHLGIDVEKVKKFLILVTALITAGLVSICGIIGFVGLIIPHIMRLVVGPNHKVLIPASLLSSAIFMVGCDILSRTIARPLEIPIGVITAIVGAPVFIMLLKRKHMPKA